MSDPRIDLEALLDGGDEEALAQALRDDPSLEGEMALQGAIDDSLRRAFAPPDLEALHLRLEEAAEVRAVVTPVPAVSPRSAWRGGPVWTIAAAAAAMVLVVLLGQWRLDQARTSEQDSIARVEVEPPMARPSTVSSRWIDLYRGLPPEGFEDLAPLRVEPGDGDSCASDGSSALVVRPQPEFVVHSECGSRPPCEQWGLDASRAYELSAGPQGLRVMVFVVAAIDDPRPSMPPGSRFSLHRRQLGHLVLYELSPLRKPVGLPAFEL